MSPSYIKEDAMTTILYNDEHIVVAVKPAGILSEGEEKNCLPTLLKEGLGADKIYTVHRLDKETEGIVVYTLTQRAAAVLSEDIVSGRWKKVYLALLTKAPEAASGRLCDLLFYDRKRGKSFVVDRERKGVKKAILDYSVIGAVGTATAVRVELQTGRTHQIRVQFASRGLILCGDRRYGAPRDSGDTLALCAAELHFLHPVTRQPLDFSISPSSFSI